MLEIICAVMALVVLEVLLSMDNALVLAILVKNLPEEQQKKALYYGIWGAYAFRFIAIILGTYLIKIWWIKLLGAIYLIQMAARYFFEKSDGDGENDKTPQKSFWKTVLSVEMMDIAFSFDSILASLGVSDQVWVLYVGGALGILFMRLAATVLIGVLKKYPQLETTAYIFILLIGLRMLGGLVGIVVPDIALFGLFAAVLAGSLLIPKKRET